MVYVYADKEGAGGHGLHARKVRGAAGRKRLIHGRGRARQDWHIGQDADKDMRRARTLCRLRSVRGTARAGRRAARPAQPHRRQVSPPARQRDRGDAGAQRHGIKNHTYGIRQDAIGVIYLFSLFLFIVHNLIYQFQVLQQLYHLFPLYQFP